MNPKTAPKQQILRRYILGKLFPACGKEPMPLNELALARQFGVNRLTVRKACLDLVKDHSLMTIPGRRGLFINPDYVQLRGSRQFIGVIGTVRQLTLIENCNFHVLSAFDRSIGDCDGDYHFLSVTSAEPDDIAGEILSCPLTGLLWLMPPAEMVPVFEKVVKAGLPAVAVAPFWKDVWEPPRFNTVLYDRKGLGRLYARNVLRTGVSRPGYLSTAKTEVFSSFAREIRNSGLACGDVSFFPIEERSWPEIRRRIRSGKIDSLVMDGTIMISFRDFYRAVPELKRIPLFIDDAPRTRLIRSVDPGFQVFFFHLQGEEHAGKLAAEMMSQLIRSGGGCIENRMVHIPMEEMFSEYDNTQNKCKTKNQGGFRK